MNLKEAKAAVLTSYVFQSRHLKISTAQIYDATLANEPLPLLRQGLFQLDFRQGANNW